MGPLRLQPRLFMWLAVGAAAAALLGSSAMLAQRAMRLRGTLNGLPEAGLPERVPIAGVNVDLTHYDDEALDENLRLIADTGFVWVRQVFSWASIESELGQRDWSDSDRVIQAAARRDLRLIAVLWLSPDWAASSQTAPPQDRGAFGSFVEAFATRYSEQIDVYQIWDEPNLSSGWGGQPPDPVGYVALLETAYHRIHAADPDALVLTAGLAPTTETGPNNLSDQLFLRAIYQNGGGHFFDGVAGKAYGFDTGPEDRRVDPGLLNFSRIILLREEMERHGDIEKPLWASHFGWNSLPVGWQGQTSIWGQTDPVTQARWTVAAFQRALSEWPWAGGFILENWQPAASLDNARWGFSLRRADGSLSVAAESLRSEKSSFNSFLWPGIYSASVPAAEYSGEWEFSNLGADIAEEGRSTVDIPFVGNTLAVIARRDNYRAYLYVTLDGRPSTILPRDERGAYQVLTSPDYQPRIEMLPLAHVNGPPAQHRIRIEAERGWDQWAIAGYAVGNDVNTRAYDLPAAGLAMLALGLAAVAVQLSRQTGTGPWLPEQAGRLAAAMGDGLHFVLALTASAAVWIGASLTWGGALPNLFRRLGDGPPILITALTAGVFYFSPWLLLTLLALVGLFVLIHARPSIGLALIMFFTPYYLLPRPLFDRAFSMVEVISLLTFAAWAIHQLASRRSADWPTPRILYARMTDLDRAIALFVLVSIVSVSWAEIKGVAVTELRQMVLEPVIVYLVMRTMPLTPAERWRIVDLLMLTGIIVAVVGFYQIVTGTALIAAEGGALRLRSVFGTPNNVALFLGRLIPICLAMSLMSRTRRRVIYAGAGLLMLGCTVLTLSKGGLLLGIPAGAVVVLILWAGRPGLVAAGIGLAGLALSMIPLSSHPRFQTLFDLGSGSSFFRVQLWQSTLRMLADHPLTGVGLDQFLYQYRGRYILPEAWQQPDLSQPHNVLLNYWVRLGIIGLAAGIWLQVAFWRQAWIVRRHLRAEQSEDRALVIGLMGSMAAFLAHGMVDEVHFVIDLAFIFFMTLGIVHQLSPGKQAVSMASHSGGANADRPE